jgi:hypothetical protein
MSSPQTGCFAIPSVFKLAEHVGALPFTAFQRLHQ